MVIFETFRRGKISVSRPPFHNFLAFLTPSFVYAGTRSHFITGLKIVLTGINLIFYTGLLFLFARAFFGSITIVNLIREGWPRCPPRNVSNVILQKRSLLVIDRVFVKIESSSSLKNQTLILSH